jgi:hypothetical protein
MIDVSSRKLVTKKRAPSFRTEALILFWRQNDSHRREKPAKLGVFGGVCDGGGNVARLARHLAAR